MKLTWQELLDLHCLVFDHIQEMIDAGDPDLALLNYWQHIEGAIWEELQRVRKEAQNV